MMEIWFYKTNLKDEIRIKHMGFDDRLERPPIDALRSIIPDNILCHIAAAGIELADAYSSDTVIAKSRRK
jgi:hypothetical protein